MRVSWLFASALVLTVPAASASAVELITNGGFESGNFTPIGGGITTYDRITAGGPQDLTGWTVTNFHNQSPPTSLVWGVNAIDINTHAGIGFVDLTGVGDTIPHGELTQTVSTIIGQQYTFSTFLTQDFSTSIVGINVFANNVALVLSGTPGFWNYAPTGATYGKMTGVFTATSTSTPIRIESILFGSRVFMIGLDDVSVTGPALSQTPIPGALPLFASGVGMMSLLAWRRKRKTAAPIAAA
jgi:hypothetical protein